MAGGGGRDPWVNFVPSTPSPRDLSVPTHPRRAPPLGDLPPPQLLGTDRDPNEPAGVPVESTALISHTSDGPYIYFFFSNNK